MGLAVVWGGRIHWPSLLGAGRQTDRQAWYWISSESLHLTHRQETELIDYGLLKPESPFIPLTYIPPPTRTHTLILLKQFY